MSGLRVLSVIHAPVFGGAHNQLLQLHAPLRNLGVETIAVLPADGEAAADRLRSAGVETHLLELGRLRATPDPRVQVRFARGLRSDLAALRSLVRDLEIDVVQVHGITNGQGASAARKEGAAVLWQIFDTRAPMPLRRLLAPQLVRSTDAMTVWGHGLVEAHPGVERLGERIVPVYPPVDTDHFAPSEELRRTARERLGVADDEIVAGSVGVVNPQKGHGGLIRAAALLRPTHPELRIRIVGASSPVHAEYEQGLRDLVADLGLHDVVDFIDPAGDVRGLLAGFDVFAMPSVPRSEGMPTAILEAMAMGIPIVATRVGATDELVEDGVTGSVVPPLDPAALAASIEALLADPDLRGQMGAAGRSQAEDRFSLPRLAEIHASAYRLAADHAEGRGAGVHGREREFFDEGTAHLDPEAMPPREYEPYESRFEDAILERLGNVAGKHVLDLGCGTGDLTLRLLQRGARVTALDISPGSVDVARRRVEAFVPDGEAEFVVGTAEQTGLDDESVDLVAGKLVLHHVDIDAASAELRRVLRPGGTGVFMETSGMNPALRVSRDALPGRAGIARYGTDDEHPVVAADLQTMRRHFGSVEADFPVMVFAYLVERHILRWRVRNTDRVLSAIDRGLGRVPALGRLSYYVRIVAKR